MRDQERSTMGESGQSQILIVVILVLAVIAVIAASQGSHSVSQMAAYHADPNAVKTFIDLFIKH